MQLFHEADCIAGSQQRSSGAGEQFGSSAGPQGLYTGLSGNQCGVPSVDEEQSASGADVDQTRKSNTRPSAPGQVKQKPRTDPVVRPGRLVVSHGTSPGRSPSPRQGGCPRSTASTRRPSQSEPIVDCPTGLRGDRPPTNLRSGSHRQCQALPRMGPNRLRFRLESRTSNEGPRSASKRSVRSRKQPATPAWHRTRSCRLRS